METFYSYQPLNEFELGPVKAAKTPECLRLVLNLAESRKL